MMAEREEFPKQYHYSVFSEVEWPDGTASTLCQGVTAPSVLSAIGAFNAFICKQKIKNWTIVSVERDN